MPCTIVSEISRTHYFLCGLEGQFLEVPSLHQQSSKGQKNSWQSGQEYRQTVPVAKVIKANFFYQNVLIAHLTSFDYQG